MKLWTALLLVLSPIASVASLASPASPGEHAQAFFSDTGDDRHTNNWAVLVGASRFWFNYRVGR